MLKSSVLSKTINGASDKLAQVNWERQKMVQKAFGSRECVLSSVRPRRNL
jgi:hypothetical protein